MNASLRNRVEQYLRLRRSLGFRLDHSEWLLGRFIDYLDTTRPEGSSTFTVEDALTFAGLPGGAASWHSARLSVLRLFAAWVHNFDPDIPLIPKGLIPARPSRAVPYLYTDRQIVDVLEQAALLRPRLRAATYQTLLGLLAVTGMRVGEVIGLDVDDFDPEAETITLREAKFGKTRMIPIHPSTADAVTGYLHLRRELLPSPSTRALLVSGRGTRLIYSNVQHEFAALTRRIGITARSTRCRPRLHDLRHTFAVNTMLDAYQQGNDPAGRLVQLATYLGHVNPSGTYWYLTASPELMTSAAGLADQLVGVPQ